MQNKSTIIGYVLILILFVAYFFVNKDSLEQIEAEKKQKADSTKLAQEKISPLVSSQTSEGISNTDTSSNSIDSINLSFKEQIFTLKNEVISVDFTSKGGLPQKVELLKFLRHDKSPLILFDKDNKKMNYTIPTASGNSILTKNLEFKPSKQTKNEIELTATIDQNTKIIQKYTLRGEGENGYLLDYDVSFEGFAEKFSPKNRYIQLDWSQQVQLQEKSIEDEQNATSIYFRYSNESGIDNLSETSEDKEILKPGIQWLSFKQKFFNATLINKEGFSEDGNVIETKSPTAANSIEDLSANLFLPVQLGAQEQYNFQLYYGPNHYQSLKKLDLKLEKIVPLGWGIFGWVNKAFIIPIFNFLEQYFSNYGIIILLLTLAIKLVLFFPMFKTYKSSAKMKLLKPELDEIKERTGGDMQKMQQEQMKLYKQAGVSPLGGCLPQLVQLPILFAMFRFFPASIELRQEKLWWADDLSSYDSIYNFPNGFEIPFYGDHVSLFTLLMTAVTLIYTYTNSQASGQMVGPMKWMMYLMPIMFLGFFNNYAAALSFYYFLATCITILQNFIIKKFFIDEAKLHEQIKESKKKKVNIKKSGFQKRLEDMAKKRGVDPYQKPGKK